MGFLGLFGKKRRPFDEAFDPYRTPGIAPDPNTIPTEASKPKSFWQGGDKFGWRDAAAGALAAVGDAFAQQNGVQGTAVSGLTSSRLSATKLAEKERERSKVVERLVANGMDPRDASVLAGDETAVRQTLAPNQEKQSPYRFRDSANNLLELDPKTGQTKLIWRDPNERFYFQDGMMVQPNNAFGANDVGRTWASNVPPPGTSQVNGETMEIPRLGQQPTLEEIRAERERRRRGY